MTNLLVVFGIQTAYAPEVFEILESAKISFYPYDNLKSRDPIPSAGSPFVLAVGSPDIRRALAKEASLLGLVPLDAIAHVSASISPSATLGPGTTVNRLSAVGSHSRIGEHVLVNRMVSIGHSSDVGDFTSFGPAVTLTGDVKVGHSVTLGAGCIVLPGVEIEPSVRIGAGAVVTKNVPPGVTMAGVPARPI